MSTKPQISSSMLTMIAKCWPQFVYRFGARFKIWPDEEIMPPSIAMSIGTATHTAVAHMLKDKIGRDAPVEPIGMYVETARMNMQGALGQEIYFPTKIDNAEFKKLQGIAMDTVGYATATYHGAVIPHVNPIAVEQPFLFSMKGIDFDLAGQPDMEEVDGIRDLKTTGRYPLAHEAMSPQMAIYSMHYFTKLKKEQGEGLLPRYVALDFLTHRKLKAGLKISYKEIKAIPDPKWIKPIYRRVEQIAQIIHQCQTSKVDPLLAAPAAKADDWPCTAKYCGYHERCEYWSGREE